VAQIGSFWNSPDRLRLTGCVYRGGGFADRRRVLSDLLVHIRMLIFASHSPGGSGMTAR
jgi:hypothetical protein